MRELPIYNPKPATLPCPFPFLFKKPCCRLSCLRQAGSGEEESEEGSTEPPPPEPNPKSFRRVLEKLIT